MVFVISVFSRCHTKLAAINRWMLPTYALRMHFADCHLIVYCYQTVKGPIVLLPNSSDRKPAILNINFEEHLRTISFRVFATKTLSKSITAGFVVGCMHAYKGKFISIYGVNSSSKIRSALSVLFNRAWIISLGMNR